jgi:hypothetical protein
VRRKPAGKVRRAAAFAASDGRALYVYGIIRACQPLHFDVVGMDARWPVHTIDHQDLAAIVSELPAGALDSTRANLLAHERVNGCVLRDHTVIPMSFGTAFRSRDDILELLRSAHDTLSDVLEKMHDRVEFGLKVFWDRGAVIREIEEEDADIRRLHTEIASQQGSGFAARMEYGRRVEAALARQSELRVAEFLRRLRDVCVASRCNRTVGDRMLMNAAFLVQRRDEAAFDQRVQAIASDFDELTFQFSGPWPPYNFVAIRLKRE